MLCLLNRNIFFKWNLIKMMPKLYFWNNMFFDNWRVTLKMPSSVALKTFGCMRSENVTLPLIENYNTHKYVCFDIQFCLNNIRNYKTKSFLINILSKKILFSKKRQEMNISSSITTTNAIYYWHREVCLFVGK